MTTKPHYYARGRYVYTNLHGHKCEFKRPETARQFAKEMNETVDKYWKELAERAAEVKHSDAFQIASRWNSNELYYRNKQNETWQPWEVMGY